MRVRRTVIAAIAALGFAAGSASAVTIESGTGKSTVNSNVSTFKLIRDHGGHGGGGGGGGRFLGGGGGGGRFLGGGGGGRNFGGGAFRPQGIPKSGYSGGYKHYGQPNFSGVPSQRKQFFSGQPPQPGAFKPPYGSGKPPYAGGKKYYPGGWQGHHRRRYWRNGRWYWYGAPLIGYGLYSTYDSCYWSCINDGYGPAYCTTYAQNYCY